MHNLISAFPLYNFLKYCNTNSLEKNILDCGAGGSNPPLSLFYEFGYKTYGIEISKEQLEKTNIFCAEHNKDLNIIQGDMKKIPFNNESFSFLFSYNTSVHMKKEDFSLALSEFYRVLKYGGLCYVNFLSEECNSYGGIQVGEGEFIQIEDNEEVFYCHYKENEIEQCFKKFEVIYKENRLIKRKIDDKEYTSAHFDYILMKK
ncbi:class I SAM-dependent methyltransferase [Clostridium tagluense]|uniref:class I SAM-dependent methyltransferase n=1 Tax=Clostridium TaxID=1485 RepID=UPI0013E90288|nr:MULTISPECIES: class I SAM-dependent methyltransferase [Clostridium]MBZ9622492.1 class I SAM-dependent methyltransferase [Clostridium sp. FP2]MCB2312926.1 class I SAM-dependent methyltransferase [Clostridium tagluense]MCB2317692.1 class I SAM-dependent methyltransferase [Clostridium tagluense]MCB2322474.1 class I SAM-dependent methyltransferase [Clostridium tagluense]MCB2327476.1 class I SAM-dependent methyltransferase [Clostridium tagluense]